MTAVRLPLVTHVATDEDTFDVHTGATARIVAARVLQRLKRLDLLADGRVLLFEPRSSAVARQLRRAGFTGEIAAMTRLPLADTALANEVDAVEVVDWEEASADPDLEQVLPDAQLYSVVVIENPERLVAEPALPQVIGWLARRTAVRGYVALVQDASSGEQESVLAALADAGCVLSCDVQHIEDTWSWAFSTYQHCPGDEARLAGNLRSIDLAEAIRPPVLGDLVTTYRDVFSGDDWDEWMRCASPECDRHYSKRQVSLLPDVERCLCGWPEPLVPFHTAESVTEKLRVELADPDVSCCYIRTSPQTSVAGFIWGYIDSADALVAMLTEGLGKATHDRLHAEVLSLLDEHDPNSTHAEVYYQSEIGVAEGTRSLSLFRWLCLRAAEFAEDRSRVVTVTRTSRLSSAYPLLLGLGMRVLLAYDSVHSEHDMQLNGDREGTGDPRVVLGGSVQQMAKLFATESDRKLALRIARQMPRSRGRGSA